MNQIAIGDSSGWTVIDGQSVAAPCRRAAPFFQFGSGDLSQERLEITLAGTPAQISTTLRTLQKVTLRALAYARGEYAYPQYIRFQQVASGSYYYAQILTAHLEENPAGYRDHQKGSLVVTLHYTRPNYFDGDQVELPLTGRAGSDVTGGINIKNHTDADANDGSTLLIKAANALTDLPAPLRIELLNNNGAGNGWNRILIGLYHHPTFTGEDPFFCQANDMTGGTQYVNAGAINGYYRTFTFTTATFASFLSYAVPSNEIDDLDGRTYRPILNLYNSHAYNDLHMRLRLMFGSYVLHVGDAVFCDPNYDYILFPPVQLPPNQLLREVDPNYISIEVQGLREGGAAATISSDQLQMFPIENALIFDQFFTCAPNDKLIYDAHRGLSVIRYGGSTEAVSHIRQGGPLLLYPGENTRLFFVMYNTANNLFITHTAQVRAYYRPRVSVL